MSDRFHGRHVKLPALLVIARGVKCDFPWLGMGAHRRTFIDCAQLVADTPVSIDFDFEETMNARLIFG
jgi:hypothetical protein